MEAYYFLRLMLTHFYTWIDAKSLHISQKLFISEQKIGKFYLEEKMMDNMQLDINDEIWVILYSGLAKGNDLFIVIEEY
jgi:hypothetical protein